MYVVQPEIGGITQQSLDYFVNQTKGAVPYLAFASRLYLLIDTYTVPNERTLQLVEVLKKALISGQLKSLTLKDLSTAREGGLIIKHLLPSFENSMVRLEELDINITEAWYFGGMSPSGGLQACRSLKRVEISVDGPAASPCRHCVTQLVWLVLSLPDSVERLIVLTWMASSNVLEIFQTILRSTSLPNLTQLALFKRSMLPIPICMSSLIETITQNKINGRSRPIQHWYFSDVYDNPLISVVELRTTGFSSSACKKLVGSGHVVYPHLKRITLEVRQTVNPFAFLQAISSQPLERFTFQIDNRARDIVWDLSCIKILASMRSLRQLGLHSVHFSLLSPKSRLSDVLPSSAWPHLTHLMLSWPELSANHLSVLLAAVPAAKDICIGSNSLTCSVMLAMVTHYCPDVVMIRIMQSNLLDTLMSAQQAFKDYPPVRGGLQRLAYLSLAAFPARAHQAFHYLLRQLHRAPLLEFVDLNPAGASPLNLYLTRCLPHLRSLFQLSRGIKNLEEGQWSTVISNLRSSKLTDCLMFRHVPYSDVVFERAHRSLDKDMYESHFTFDETVTEMYGAFSLYPCFRPSLQNNPGLSGGEAFYDRLYDLLSDEEKMLTML